jgi:hypothetical protein
MSGVAATETFVGFPGRSFYGRFQSLLSREKIIESLSRNGK